MTGNTQNLYYIFVAALRSLINYTKYRISGEDCSTQDASTGISIQIKAHEILSQDMAKARTRRSKYLDLSH